MQHARVRCVAVSFHALQRLFQHGHRLEGVGARCRLPGAQVPQQPGCAVDQGFGKQRSDVRIIGKGPIDIAHGRRIGIVPAEELLEARRLVGLVALLQCPDQPLLHRRGTVDMCQRGLCRQPGLGYGLLQLLLDEGIPALVVVGARGVGDAPVGHCAIAIVFDRLAKTTDGFIVVVAVAP
ncbi:hypothetical protein D3C84_747670 [compost metagenome]